MHVVRTIGWVLITMIFMGFIFMNWGDTVAVRFWPLRGQDNLLVEWPVGFVATFFFLLGLIPTWLLHRGTKWRLTRRINTLETAARMPQVAPVQTSPSETLEPAEPAPSSSSYTPNSPL
jgi:putative membrane protein